MHLLLTSGNIQCNLHPLVIFLVSVVETEDPCEKTLLDSNKPNTYARRAPEQRLDLH